MNQVGLGKFMERLRGEVPEAFKGTEPKAVPEFVVKGTSGSVEIVFTSLLEFLKSEGFAIYKRHGLCRNEMVFVHVAGHVIHRVSDVEIRRHMTSWVKSNRPHLFEAWLHKVGGLGGGIFEQLEAINPPIHSDTQDRIFLYFSNGILEITGEGWSLRPYSSIDGFIWEAMRLERNWVEDRSTGDWSKFLANIMGGDAERLRRLKTGIGYLLSRHKDMALSKAVILTDESLDSESGGTGKGLLLKGISKLRKIQSLDFRTRRPDHFLFQGVSPDSNVVHIEDADKRLDFGILFNAVTGDLEIENKGETRLTVPFSESPKLAISTNFQFRGSSDSHARRKIEYELASHYSAHHTPLDDFGHSLFSGWDSLEWHRFDTVMAGCAMAFLKEGLLGGLNLNVARKRLDVEVGKGFAEFMDAWTGKLSAGVSAAWQPTANFVDEYRTDSGDCRASTADVSRKLRKWADLRGWILTDKRGGGKREIGRAHV